MVDQGTEVAEILEGGWTAVTADGKLSACLEAHVPGNGPEGCPGGGWKGQGLRVK